jgi:RNA polymerase sigma factor (sigma-70 family)
MSPEERSDIVAPMTAPDTAAGPRTFQPTLWTLVLRAKDPAAPDRREALERLFVAYWKPLYVLLRREHDAEAAQDLVQGFFAAFLEKDYLKAVDRAKGSFRSFLRAALRHYVADVRDRERAQKRGGGRPVLSLDFARAETEIARTPSEAPERAFERQWALEVLKRALQALRAEFGASGRLAEFETLHVYLSAGGREGLTHADLAKRLGTSESDVNNRVHRLRGRWRELIREEIRAYTETPEEADGELRDLFAAVGRR